jgi:hypothetical protein
VGVAILVHLDKITSCLPAGRQVLTLGVKTKVRQSCYFLGFTGLAKQEQASFHKERELQHRVMVGQ